MTENELRSVFTQPWLAFYPRPSDATMSKEDNAQCAGFYRSIVTPEVLLASPLWTILGTKRVLTVKGQRVY